MKKRIGKIIRNLMIWLANRDPEYRELQKKKAQMEEYRNIHRTASE